MDIQKHLIAQCDKAWSEYQQAFIQRAPVEEQNRLLRKWSTTHLRLLFAAQEGRPYSDQEQYLGDAQ